MENSARNQFLKTMNEPALPSVPNAPSYIDSHKAPGKGESYDEYYASDPERRYLWEQERRVLNCILREFYGDKAVHLLDFACGTGRIASFLESQVASSCAVDVSDSMLEVARKKLVRARLLNANLLIENPFPKASFNLITAFRFFLNAEPDLRTAALKTLEPLLEESGCLVFNIHQNTHSLYYWPTRLYTRLLQKESSVTLSIGQCSQVLKQVGLKIVRVYPVGLLHIPKLRFRDRTRKWVDEAAIRCSVLGRISDSPIIVARKSV
jgi:ubiquinone/menaquinone biosynthesis C-methylase UbiE